MAVIDLLQQSMPAYLGLVGIVSLFVGSFLNVVIHRLPIMMERAWQASCEELDDTLVVPAAAPFNLSVPRSHCPHCNALVRWWQNLPVLSYLLLRGRCHRCRQPISIRYPLVELATMGLSLVVAWWLGPTLPALLGILVTWFLVAMSMIDLDHKLLPDSLTLPLMWIGLLASLVPVFAHPGDAIIGAAAGYLVLWMVFHAFRLVTGKEGMGYGDFKLLAAWGALLGWQLLPVIILLSSLVGAVVGVTLIAITGRDRNVPIPFGPFLAAAGWIGMLWGDRLANWYASGFLA